MGGRGSSNDLGDLGGSSLALGFGGGAGGGWGRVGGEDRGQVNEVRKSCRVDRNGCVALGTGVVGGGGYAECLDKGTDTSFGKRG